MSRKATITANWKEYGLSTSLEVEAPDLITYFKLKCSELTNQGGWIKSPYDTVTYLKWFTFEIETDADDETLQAAIDNGDLYPDGYTGDTSVLYELRVNKGKLSFDIAFVFSPASSLDIFANTTVRSIDIWFVWNVNGTQLEDSFNVKFPPFGAKDIFTMPSPSSIDEYYHDIENTLSFTKSSTYNSDYVDQWIKNGSLSFSPEIRHLQYRYASSTYRDCILAPYQDWNGSSAKGSDYASASLDNMTITFLKMIYYDAAIALGFAWIDTGNSASNYGVYMVRNVNGFQYTVSQVISNTASQQLYYAPGFINTINTSYNNPANMTMGILSAPTSVTTSSSGFTFANGNLSGSTIWPTCFLMIRFSSSAYAKCFVEMVRSHCIEVTLTTNGSGSQVAREYYETTIDGIDTNLEIPSGNHNGIQINFGSGPSTYSSSGSAQTEVTAEPGTVSYGSYYYVPLFKWVEYDVLNASLATSQGIRLRYTGVGVSGTTQHSSPSYFYPTSEDAIWRILTCY